MKFSHSLKFNAVPEWTDGYLNYSGLKKVIYKLQQEQIEGSPNDGSIVVRVNETSVSDIINEVRIDSGYKVEENGEGVEGSSNDEQKLSARITSKFRRGKDSVNVFRKKRAAETEKVDLESQVGSSAQIREGSEKEKDSGARSFTVDLDSSSTLPLGGSVFDWDLLKSEDENRPLITFTQQLLAELHKINEFYASKESEIFMDVENLLEDLRVNNVDIEEAYRSTEAYRGGTKAALEALEHHHDHLQRTLSKAGTITSVFDPINHMHEDLEKGEKGFQFEDDDDDDDEDDDEEHDINTSLLNHSDFNVKEQKKIALRKKSVVLFIALSELKSFVELNKIGFTKITKKFDKTCNYAIKKDFTDSFLPKHSKAFATTTIPNIDAYMSQIVNIYAYLSGRLNSKTTADDLEYVKDELKSHLREHIVWERNTVWKDLLSLEMKSYNIQLDRTATQAGKIGDEGAVNIMNLSVRSFKLPRNIKIFGYDHFILPSFIFTSQMIKVMVAVVVFIILMCVSTFNDPVQHRCLALLVAVAILWASEGLPLYITAMLVPFLVVVCKVLKNTDGSVMSGPDASAYILGQMWSSVIMILLGGFTLAAALSKYNIARIISSYILAFAGTKPRNILISIMSVSLFLSMWISNVAAPVLCFSLIQPVLRTLPTRSPFSQALVLGIALSSNIAGMSSPISSPQNVVALQSMSPNPGWGKWFAVALPVSIIGMILIWLELVLTFKISSCKVKAYKPIKERFTVKQIYISGVTITTIILWCVLTKTESVFGESGIIAIIPIVLFFGTGILKVSDLNNFPWSIIILAMGGIALGKAVSSSGLLKTIATWLQHKVEHLDVFAIMAIFGILILIVATFVSHTVAALIIIPLVKEIGENLPDPHPLLLVMGTALLASSAMALPTSGFPNVTAISMTDEVGKPYLTVNCFITRGIPASLIAYVCVITVGYGIMSSLDF